MKKIIRKIFSAVLTITCLASVCACGDSSGASKDPSSGSDAKKNEILLADFEAWSPDFALCRISPQFGKVSMNKDAQYVDSGNHSARIDPVGNGWMYLSTKSELFAYDYTDFTHVNSVRMKMYNPQSIDCTVTVGLVSDPNGLDRITQSGGKTFTLNPGWNTINYYIDPFIVSMIADLKDIRGIYLAFTPINVFEITDTTPRFYLDSMSLRYMDEPHVVNGTLDFEQNEVMDFEKFYQSNFFVNPVDIDMKVIKPAEYGISDVSGEKALRMVVPGTASGAWRSYFKILGPYMELSPLNNLSEEQFNNAYFCWDVYNASESVFNIVAIFNDNTEYPCYKIGTYPKCGQWSTFRIKLTDVAAVVPDWKTDMGAFTLDILDNQTTDREIFVDNFRIEIE